MLSVPPLITYWTCSRATGPACYQPFKKSALQERRRPGEKREMGRCEGSEFAGCVRGKWLFFFFFLSPFGRLTFHWCDWREMQQQGLGCTPRMEALDSVWWRLKLCQESAAVPVKRHISSICSVLYIYYSVMETEWKKVLPDVQGCPICGYINKIIQC